MKKQKQFGAGGNAVAKVPFSMIGRITVVSWLIFHSECDSCLQSWPPMLFWGVFWFPPPCVGTCVWERERLSSCNLNDGEMMVLRCVWFLLISVLMWLQVSSLRPPLLVGLVALYLFLLWYKLKLLILLFDGIVTRLYLLELTVIMVQIHFLVCSWLL